MNKIILVVCEGKSEKAYLQELNRFLRENEIPLLFKVEVSEGGDYHFVDPCFRKCQKENKRMRIVIWVDRDIYRRNDRGNQDAYTKKPKGIPNFKFNIENFEDFLVMHLTDDRVDLWHTACSNNGHFTSPLHAREYGPLLQSAIFPTYKKGTLPENFVIDFRALQNLKNHNADTKIPFRSEFADFMITEIELETKSLPASCTSTLSGMQSLGLDGPPN